MFTIFILFYLSLFLRRQCAELICKLVETLHYSLNKIFFLDTVLLCSRLKKCGELFETKYFWKVSWQKKKER